MWCHKNKHAYSCLCIIGSLKNPCILKATVSLGRKHSFFQHLGTVLHFLCTKKRGGGRSEGSKLLGGSFPLITMCSLLSMRTWSSAGLQAEAFVTVWSHGFWRFLVSMQDITLRSH